MRIRTSHALFVLVRPSFESFEIGYLIKVGCVFVFGCLRSRFSPLSETMLVLFDVYCLHIGAMSSDEKGKDLWNVLSKHTVTFREMVRADKTLLTSHFDFAYVIF